MTAILIVNTDRGPLAALQEEFEGRGYRTLAATSAEQAIAFLLEARSNFSGVVTNISLSSTVTGWDVARHARALNPSIPIAYIADEPSAWPVNGVPDSVLLGTPMRNSQAVSAFLRLCARARTDAHRQGRFDFADEPQEAPERSLLLKEEIFFARDWSSTALGEPEQWDPQLSSWVVFMLHSAQPMFILWGPERLFLFNDAFRPILGDHYVEALGASLPHLWKEMWSDVGALIDQAFDGGSGIVAEKPLLTWASDFQEALYFTFSYSPIHNQVQEVVATAGLLADTTIAVRSKEALRRERDALHALFEQAPSFMAMIEGPEHRFTFANAAYHQLIRRTGIMGRALADVLPELVEQGVIKVLDAAYASGKPCISHGFSLRLDDETGGARERCVDLIYQPVFDAEGGVTGIFIEGQDVTERHEAQMRIATLQDELAQASRINAVDTIASTLAHELNQPLTAIHSYMSAAAMIAERQEIDPRLLECYRGTRDAALRAGAIIRSLGELTTRGHGRMQPLDLEAIVRDAVDLGFASHPQAAATFDFRSARPVSGDRVQIQQILFNLVRNACDSSGERCELTITTRDEGPLVELCVSDRGSGIPEDVLPLMFEPFKTTKPSGMGVGLSICRTIIEAHGGTIAARNNDGPGATICFTLA